MHEHLTMIRLEILSTRALDWSKMKSLNQLTSAIRRTPIAHRVGRIQNITGTSVDVSGLSDIASIGHEVKFCDTYRLSGEVAAISEDKIRVIVAGSINDLKIGDPMQYLGEFKLFPNESWLGRVLDANAAPIDGRPLHRGTEGIARFSTPPDAFQRRSMGERIMTGYSLFDTILPIVKGQRVGIFAGSGVGKSSLIASFAQNIHADVVVIALIGERGREVGHFLHYTLGKSGLRRSVVIASTSDQSPVSRRNAAFTAMAVAEFFRDQGRHVLLLLDSITRFAEAHREIASASGEDSSIRGYPPSLNSRIASFVERAGPGAGSQGDITAILTVLVQGDDLDEPVSDVMRGLMDGHVVLSREIAEKGRYPAVDVLQSVSRALPLAASDEENSMISEARRLMNLYADSELMVRSGLYEAGGNKDLDFAIHVNHEIENFVTTKCVNADSAFTQLNEILKKIPNDTN